MKKAVFVTNIPNPYRVALFNEMSRQFGEQGIQLKLIFGAPGYKRRMFELNEDEIWFSYEILNDKGYSYSKDGEKTVFFYRGLLKLLKKENPDVVLVAGFSPATMKILWWNLLSKVPFIIFSGTHEKGKRALSRFRKMQREFLIKRASAFVAYGNLARQYLIAAGAEPETVFIARNTVDTEYFATKTHQLRERIRISESPAHFTCLGYLVPRKNVMALLRVLVELKKLSPDFVVDIVGDGTERDALMNFVRTHNLEEQVQFHGFRQQQEIPEFLAACRCLLFQTNYDIWGLVLNEAMAAGVPCIASPNAGATHDLVINGVNGFVVDFENTSAAAEKMKWIMDHPDQAKQMGEAAADYIRNHVTISDAAQGFLDAVLFALPEIKNYPA